MKILSAVVIIIGLVLFAEFLIITFLSIIFKFTIIIKKYKK